MLSTGVAPVTQWRAGSLDTADDLIAGETPVALTYNRRAHVVMMATATDLEDFALGFSLSEGIVRNATELLSVTVLERESGLELAMTVSAQCQQRLAGQRRNLTGRTGCGLCGAETLEQAVRYGEPVVVNMQLSHGAVQTALESLSARQPLQAATGAVHCAAWCASDGELLAVREDVGRHNALDKLIGHLAVEDLPAAEGFFLVSSRASYEMVAKTVSAGVGVLVAVSAPTTLAVSLAEHCGLTLVGFARPQRHNVYTHSHRLTT